MTREEAIEILKDLWRTKYSTYLEADIRKALEMAIQALEQEPSGDAVSRDFQIGDEVRIIGSDPIYDDCDVGWVIRNASERVKTMYVMRNDGSAEEENKEEWYKTGRHNTTLAEVIKALPSVNPQPKTGHWIIIDDCEKFIAKCSECGQIEDSRMIGKYAYCHCGARMESEVNNG